MLPQQITDGKQIDLNKRLMTLNDSLRNLSRKHSIQSENILEEKNKVLALQWQLRLLRIVKTTLARMPNNHMMDKNQKIEKLKILLEPQALKEALTKLLPKQVTPGLEEITIDCKNISHIINPIIDHIKSEKNYDLLLKNSISDLNKGIKLILAEVRNQEAKYNAEIDPKINDIVLIETEINTSRRKMDSLQAELKKHSFHQTTSEAKNEFATNIIDEITRFKNDRIPTLFFSRKPKNAALDTLIEAIKNNKHMTLLETLISEWLYQFEPALKKNRNLLNEGRELFIKHSDTATEAFIKRLRENYGHMPIPAKQTLTPAITLLQP